jgi:hypothetical protein
MACGCSSIRLQIIHFKKENYVDLYWHLDLLMGVSMTGLKEALLPKETKASDSPMRSKLPRGARRCDGRPIPIWDLSLLFFFVFPHAMSASLLGKVDKNAD